MEGVFAHNSPGFSGDSRNIGLVSSSVVESELVSTVTGVECRGITEEKKRVEGPLNPETEPITAINSATYDFHIF